MDYSPDFQSLNCPQSDCIKWKYDHFAFLIKISPLIPITYEMKNINPAWHIKRSVSGLLPISLTLIHPSLSLNPTPAFLIKSLLLPFLDTISSFPWKVVLLILFAWQTPNHLQNTPWVSFFIQQPPFIGLKFTLYIHIS